MKENTNNIKAAVLGSGSWGTALSILLGKKGVKVSLWGRSEDLLDSISKERMNSKYLPNIKLPDCVDISKSIDNAIKSADAVVMAVPSTAIREVLGLLKGKIDENTLLIHAGKGLESETGLRGSEIITSIMGEEIGRKCVALSGPNLAVELANSVPTATVVASKCKECAVKAQELFSCNSLRVYRGDDVIGLELGGALKNVIAIASGICEGLGFGDNTRATLVTRGMAEISRLGVAMGADFKTFTGLSGFGDLMATCSSRLSRNLRLGLMIGKGKSLEESLKTLGQVAEGLQSCEAAILLGKKYKVDMPISNQLYEVLFNQKKPIKAVEDLMAREYKEESY
ncbi:MAG: NAD(P)H-dependent glycerol-3-phosphate dehydrogenase [Armatimonadota bacterium]